MTLLFAQVTHSLGLNDVCDALALHSGPLSAIRGATAPKRNTLSNANRKRNPVMAEKLFWQTLEHLQKLCPGFACGRVAGLPSAAKGNPSGGFNHKSGYYDLASSQRKADKCHLGLNPASFYLGSLIRRATVKSKARTVAGQLAGKL
jgi:hypothetical protein